MATTLSAASTGMTGSMEEKAATSSSAACSDSFYFDLTGELNADLISDFDSATDTILLEADVFGDGGDLGALLEAAYGEGTSATTAEQRIVYDRDTGNLYFDEDGNGAIDPVVFARLTSGTQLDHSDFSLV